MTTRTRTYHINLDTSDFEFPWYVTSDIDGDPETRGHHGVLETVTDVTADDAVLIAAFRAEYPTLAACPVEVCRG